MKKFCTKTCIISFIAVFIFLNLYSMLVHGNLLMADYEMTPELWRTPEEMEAFGAWWPLYYALLAMILCCWFKKTKACMGPCNKDAEKPNSSMAAGVCFGVKLGVLMGLMMGSSYLYMPVSLDLAVKWFFTGLFEGIGVGIILGVTCRDRNCSTDSKAGA